LQQVGAAPGVKIRSREVLDLRHLWRNISTTKHRMLPRARTERIGCHILRSGHNPGPSVSVLRPIRFPDLKCFTIHKQV
jgi:hypothetical protein